MYKLNNWFIRFNNRGKINYYVEKNIYEGEDQNDNVINRGCGLEKGNGIGYGVMVLSPIDILEYTISEKEIVGDGFNVRMHGSLHDEQTWYEMWRILGGKVFDELPSHIRQEYDGAKELFENYLICKNNE